MRPLARQQRAIHLLLLAPARCLRVPQSVEPAAFHRLPVQVMQLQHEALVALQASQPTEPAVAAAEVRAAECLEMLKWVAGRASGLQIKVGAADRLARRARSSCCMAVLVGQYLPSAATRAIARLLAPPLHAPQALLEPSGAGIMCTAAAAFPHLYLRPPTTVAAGAAAPVLPFNRLLLGLTPPPAELHFRLRGRVDVFEAGQAARLDCAEMQLLPGGDYPGAVEALGMRLGMLRWLAGAALGVPDEGVRALGRLYVCGIGEGEEGCEGDEALSGDGRLALHALAHDWGFELHVLHAGL
jgi:hypothetical protein